MSREIEYVDPYALTIIGLDTEDNQEHHLFQERVFLPVDENLVKNIKVYGIQQPVIVRKDGDQMIVIDGRQRTRAARRACDESKEAGEHPIKVPVRVVMGTDARVTGIMISTNELRQDDSILDKALQASRLLSQLGDIEQVALAFGRTTATIKNWLSLVEADPQIHTCIRAGKLSVTTAIEISRLKREDQRVQLENFLRTAGNGKVSEKAVKEALSVSDSNKATPKATEEDDDGPTRKSGQSHNQQGVKRVWLRRALSTQAAEVLTDEQRAVLQWFCTGVAPEGEWFTDFMEDAESELSNAPKGKRGRKPKTVKPETIKTPVTQAYTAKGKAKPKEVVMVVEEEDDEEEEVDIQAELAGLASPFEEAMWGDVEKSVK